MKLRVIRLTWGKRLWGVVDFRGRVYAQFHTEADALYFAAAMSDEG